MLSHPAKTHPSRLLGSPYATSRMFDKRAQAGNTSGIVKFTLPMMTDVQKGAIAADRLALTRPPGGQNAQHCVPVIL